MRFVILLLLLSSCATKKVESSCTKQPNGEILCVCVGE